MLSYSCLVFVAKKSNFVSTATLLREAAQIQSSLMSQIWSKCLRTYCFTTHGQKNTFKLKVISGEYFLVEKASLDGLPDELRWFGVLLSLVGVVGDNRSDEVVAHCSCAT